MTTRDEMLAALEMAHEHIGQYMRYSEEMRKIGRGLYMSSAHSPESVYYTIAAILAKDNNNG